MKIFVDTADLDEIRELASWGIIDGITTNPTLVARSGRSFEEIIDEIFNILNGPISIEVLSKKEKNIVKETKKLVLKIDKKFRKNIVIKIPMNPEGLKININLPDKEELKIFASTNMSFIGDYSSHYNNFSYENEAVVNIPIHHDDSHELIVITPINLSGQIYGTYEILISMSQSYNAFDNQAKNLIMISIVSLFVLVFNISRHLIPPSTDLI